MNRYILVPLLLFLTLFLQGQTIFEELQEPFGFTSSNLSSSEQNVFLIDSIVDFALTKVGATYQYGASGPDRFDCSGFVRYTFKKFGISLLRSSKLQYTMGKPVKREDIKKGDLVFFRRGNGIGHVGLVIEVDSMGTYRFVHASTYKTGVRIDNSRKEGYARTYVGARRILEITEPVPVIEDSLFMERATGFYLIPAINLVSFTDMHLLASHQPGSLFKKGYTSYHSLESVLRRKKWMNERLKK